METTTCIQCNGIGKVLTPTTRRVQVVDPTLDPSVLVHTSTSVTCPVCDGEGRLFVDKNGRVLTPKEVRLAKFQP